mmetsp:Transcript_102596/g.295450  ORF Transcript_102596/g.295450 Transcript_102596/m.295450 type:complete len:89 (-) Transcript_102596:555-821(-)
MTQNKLSQVFIQSEAVGSRTQSQNQKGGRRVEAVSGSNKVGSRLKSVDQALSLFFRTFDHQIGIDLTVFIVFINSNNGTSRDSSINVR